MARFGGSGCSFRRSGDCTGPAARRFAFAGFERLRREKLRPRSPKLPNLAATCLERSSDGILRARVQLHLCSRVLRSMFGFRVPVICQVCGLATIEEEGARANRAGLGSNATKIVVSSL